MIIQEKVKELQEKFKDCPIEVKIKDILDKYRQADSISNINRGGCAILAYSIVEYAKILDVEAKVVYLFNLWSTRDYYNLKDNEGNGSCSHAVVEIDGVQYDSTGVFDADNYFDKGEKIKSLEVSKAQLEESIQYRKHWNNCFDRNRGLREIEKILGISIDLSL